MFESHLCTIIKTHINMEIQKESIIGDIVSKNYAYTDVLYAHQIDFCCGGGVSIQTACQNMGYDEGRMNQILTELNKMVISSFGVTEKANDWPLSFLVDYIEENHHKYIEKNVPIIQAYLDKITSVHGQSHPELHRVNALFKASGERLTQHLKKEELQLFPSVKKLAAAVENEAITPEVKSQFDELMAVLNDEHEDEGASFKTISELTNQYQAPEDACNSYRVTYAKLKEFEFDLHQHVHLENNVLFGRIKALLD